MAQNLLEQLRKYTTVVADTGDIHSMEQFRPTDATTNPSLITAAAQMPQYQPIVDGVLLEAKKNWATARATRMLPTWRSRILQSPSARKSWPSFRGASQRKWMRGSPMTPRARSPWRAALLRSMTRRRLAATMSSSRLRRRGKAFAPPRCWRKEGIHCNLTLLFGIHQAVAAAEAGATLVSPFVGRILDWYKKDTGKDYQGADDPGVQSVTRIYDYYKKFGYKTQVMGASFRNIGEIEELAGCDLLTISPHLLGELEKTEGDLPRKLDPEKAKALPIERIVVDKATFKKMHAEDRMATDKLKEGIEGFSAALVNLEQLLAKRLAELESRAPATV